MFVSVQSDGVIGLDGIEVRNVEFIFEHGLNWRFHRAIMDPLEVYFGEPRVLPDFLDTVFAAAIALGGLAHQHQSNELFARMISQPRGENNVPFADVAVHSRVTVRRVFKRVSPAKHLVNEHAEGPHVNALAVAPAVDDLGGHVLGGTAEGVSATPM